MINVVYCRKCHEPIDSADTFCKKCGVDQRPPAQQPLPDSATITLPPTAVLPLNASTRLPIHLTAILTMWGVYVCGWIFHFISMPIVKAESESGTALGMGMALDVISFVMIAFSFVIGIYLVRQPNMVDKINGGIKITCDAILAVVMLLGFLILFKVIATTPKAQTTNASPDLPAISVQEVRENSLRYNGKNVHIKAYIVDMGDSSFTILDNPPQYAEWLSNGYFGLVKSKTIRVKPTISGLTFNDLGDFDGVYDAEDNLLHLSNAKKTGHYGQ